MSATKLLGSGKILCLAHDLRTPLLASSRMLALLQEGALGPLPTEAADALGIMYRSNQNLLVMVNNLLEIYRHASGKKTLHLTPIHLPALLAEVVAELTPLAAQKGLAIQVSLPAHASSTPSATPSLTPLQPLQVMADNIELRRVLVNLLDNAIKFTDVGQIHVGVCAVEGNGRAHLGLPKTSQPAIPPVSSASSASLQIFIQDSGPGISPADRINLFDRFSQGQHRRSGSGLGLHLSHQIISLHGGQLRFNPVPEGGSRFEIILPTVPATTGLSRISQGVIG
jgi:two-component system, sensor histidine kinase and response regulator